MNTITARRLDGSPVGIPIDSVICLVADHKYVTIYHDEGENLTEQSLVEIDAQHPGRFVRTHRGALVAKGRLAGLNAHGTKAWAWTKSQDWFPVPVSRRNKPGVRRMLADLRAEAA